MTRTRDQQDFETRAKASLDESVLKLDKKTRADLAAIRQQVLNKAHRPKPWLSFNVWVPVGAFAFCALLTVFLLFNPDSIDDTTRHTIAQQSDVNAHTEQIAMLELLSSPEELETAGDPAFYVWLDEILATKGADNAV